MPLSSNFRTAPVQVAIQHNDRLIAGLAALAISIHVLESSLPSPIPGIKPGLANLITLYALIRYGWLLAFNVTLIRVVAASLLLGSFLSPTFMLSFAGASGSLLILGLFWHFPGRPFGPVGLSILSAMTHITMQMIAAYFLFIPHASLFTLLPVLLTTALISGTLGGILVSRILERTAHESTDFTQTT